MREAKFELIDKMDRGVLSEGRNFGTGFAFCKRTGDTVETVMPLSACSDYLNDQLYSEHSGRPYYACGFNSSKHDIFSDGWGYLLMGVCKRGARNPVEYDNYKRDCDALNANYKNLEGFLNHFEKELKLKQKTKIVKIKDNCYIIILPLFWTEATYLISLYKLIARMAIFYESGDPMEFLTNFNKDATDSYLIKSALPKFKLILSGVIPKQNFNSNISWHNAGIIGYQFPTGAAPTIAVNAPVKKETVIHEGLAQVWKPMKFA